jgi:hypothetical protein
MIKSKLRNKIDKLRTFFLVIIYFILLVITNNSKTKTKKRKKKNKMKTLTLLIIVLLNNNLINSLIYKAEFDGYGVREPFLTNRQMSQSVVTNYAKCVRICTDNKYCHAGQFDTSTKNCRIFSAWPLNFDIAVIANKLIFYKSNKKFQTLT